MNSSLFRSAVSQVAATTPSGYNSEDLVSKTYELARKWEMEFSKRNIPSRIEGEMLALMHEFHRKSLIGFFAVILRISKELAESIVDTEIIGKTTIH